VNFRLLYDINDRFAIHKVVREKVSYKLCHVKKVLRRVVSYKLCHVKTGRRSPTSSAT
jgi:ribosomal protein S4E